VNVIYLVSESVSKEFDCCAFISFPDMGIIKLRRALLNMGIELASTTTKVTSLYFFLCDSFSPRLCVCVCVFEDEQKFSSQELKFFFVLDVIKRRACCVLHKTPI
jgi:hypothetical protein